MLTDLSFRVTTSIIINLFAYKTRQDDYLTMKDSQAMLYALSCFNNQEKAERRYSSLCKSFKRTPKVIGDSLCGGIIENDDGMITLPDLASGHFDLYESETCDLSKTFNIIEKLWKN